MNHEELAFVNLQLAGMLKTGIPLEGALRQLCVNMRHGRFRSELQALEADLARGLPLKEALSSRKLPGFYVKMLQLGALTNDLPGVLTLIADYYQRAHLLGARLKGLMVYPLIVLGASMAVSALLAVFCTQMLSGDAGAMSALFGWGNWTAETERLLWIIWAPVATLSITVLAVAIALFVPGVRDHLRWRLPAFRENALTNFAATMNLMLRSGGNLGDALELARQLEAGSPAEADVRLWQERLAAGQTKIAEIGRDSHVFPPLFLWLVAQGGEDLAAGFKKAAEIYFARARHRIELFLYSVLPVSVLLLGLMILGQFTPMFRALTLVLDSLGGAGDL